MSKPSTSTNNSEERLGSAREDNIAKTTTETTATTTTAAGTISPRQQKTALKSLVSSMKTSAASAASTKNIEAKLERIEKIILALDKSHFQGKDAAPSASAMTSLSAIETGEPSAGTTTDIVTDEELHVQERSRLQYGQRLASILGLKKLTIKIARSLEPSKYVNNSFKQSYSYDKSSDVLIIHQSRLVSSGDFGLVVIHALSHIKVTCCATYS